MQPKKNTKKTLRSGMESRLQASHFSSSAKKQSDIILKVESKFDCRKGARAIVSSCWFQSHFFYFPFLFLFLILCIWNHRENPLTFMDLMCHLRCYHE